MQTKAALEFLHKIESKCSQLEPEHKMLAVRSASKLFYCNLAIGAINLAIASALVTHLLKQYPSIIYVTLALTLSGSLMTLIVTLSKMGSIPSAHLDAVNQCRSIRRQLEWLELESRSLKPDEPYPDNLEKRLNEIREDYNSMRAIGKDVLNWPVSPVAATRNHEHEQPSAAVNPQTL